MKQPTSDPNAAPPHRTFTTFLAAVEDGNFHSDLTKKLRELLGDMSNHRAENGGKCSGAMNISFGFTLDKEIVEVVAKVETKSPKAPRGRSVMWLTPENNLVGENPRQQKLPLRDVSAGGEAKVV